MSHPREPEVQLTIDDETETERAYREGFDGWDVFSHVKALIVDDAAQERSKEPYTEPRERIRGGS